MVLLQLLAVAIIIVAAALIYAVLLRFLRLPEFILLYDKLCQRFARN